MLANEQGCGYFSADSQNITISQPACIAALDKVKAMKDAGTLTAANWAEKVQSNTAGKVATQMYGGWYDGTIRSTSPDLSGKWGVYMMPSMTPDGQHAANLGGSSLAIAENSPNKEAAWKFVNYALGTNEGQVTMLKSFGLVPSLLSAVKDPFVNEPLPYYDNQKIWVDILGTLPKISPSPGTQYFSDADAVFRGSTDEVPRRRLSGRKDRACRRCSADRFRNRTAGRQVSDTAGRAFQAAPGIPAALEAAGMCPTRQIIGRKRRRLSCGCETERLRVPCTLFPGVRHLLDLADHQFVPDLVSEHTRQSVGIQLDQLGAPVRRPGLLQCARKHADHPGDPGSGHDLARDRHGGTVRILRF